MTHLSNIKSISNRFKNLLLATAFVLTQFVVPASSLFMGTAAAAGDLCTVDTAGANDEPGQKDLTKLCVNYDNVPTTVSTTFNWDETGTSGANTMDACNLFDTDGDGNINYAVCLTTMNDPAELQFFKTYSCGDTKIDRCTSPATEISSGSTVCTVSQVTNDPFVNGTSSPKDTQGACTVQLSTVGGSSAKLIDVCSYPSNQPNSDPSDCVIARPNSAKLEVVKQLDPETDLGRFDLKINGTTYATNVGDGGTTGTQVVTVDNQHPTQTVLEQANSTTNPTSLSNYTTTVVCRDLHGTGQIVGSSSPSGATTRQLTVTIAAESDVVCVFTNTRATGHITVTKVVNNLHGGTATTSQFPLYVNDTSVTSGVSNSFTANQQYTVSESGGPSGYTQTSLSCKATGSDTELGATFTLAADANVNCTITNTDIAPTLTLVKEVVGGTATASDWTLSATPTSGQTLSGDGGFSEQNAVANVEYTLSESGGPSGYTASAWSCDGGTQVGSKLTLALADDVTCTITNTRDTGTVTVNKIINPANDSGLFNLKINGETNYTANDQGNGGTTGTRTVNTGSYTVSETAGTNTGLGDYSSQYICMDGVNQVAAGSATSSTSFNVAKGHNVICTFTNTRFGSISGTKVIVNADGSPTGGDASGWTVFLDSNNNGTLDNGELFTTTDGSGNFSFDHLLPNNYNIVEVLTSGWTQIYSPNPNPVALDAGENSTGNDFGNFENGSISGYKFNDLNGNGQQDDGEPKLSGWTINLYDDQDVLVTSKVTNVDGNYTFDNLAPGAYKVCEEGQAGWTQTSTPECYTVDIDESGEANLNIVFGNQGRGSITVKKNVDTNGDGQVDEYNVGSWTWDLSGDYINDANYQNLATGVTKSNLPVDNYTIHEDQKTNYHFVSVVCSDENGELEVTQDETTSVNLGVGDNITCTFTNARDTGYLKVVKDVVNNNSGTKTYADFTFTVNGGEAQNFEETASPDGAKTVMVVTGAYDVVEPEANTMDYTTSYNNCTDVAVTTENTAENPAVCVITNDDVAHPSIQIVKDGPAMAHEGDTLTYTATITNTGDAPLDVVGVEDNVAGTVTITYENGYPVGDDDNDGLLDLDETWYGTVDYVVPDGQTDNIVNTMTVCADDATGTEPIRLLSLDSLLIEQEQDLEGDVCDSDTHTTDVLHPGINVVKQGKNSAHAGSTVTYTFTVTNTGDTPVAVSSVEDSIAGDGTYESGDTDSDGLLDLDETWIYTADYKIPANQIANVNNTVTVCAYDQLEEEVCDQDSHSLTIPKVLGATTELPNTGQGPLLNFIAGAMLILLALGTRWVGRKSQTATL